MSWRKPEQLRERYLNAIATFPRHGAKPGEDLARQRNSDQDAELAKIREYIDHLENREAELAKKLKLYSWEDED